MIITNLLAVQIRSGFFADDQAAILAGAGHDGFAYIGTPITPGFTSIRQSGEAVSIMLVLQDGQIGYGDCAAVQYSGAGGRDPVFNAAQAVEEINRHLVPFFAGKDISNFRTVANELENFLVDGKQLHSAIRYGISQALLDAVAKSRAITMAEVIQEEYETGIEITAIPLFVQSGDNRYDNVDKMIMKSADVLPHGLINNVETKLGKSGEIFSDYLTWVHDRILALRASPTYNPTLHFDMYGTVGRAFNSDVEKIADYLVSLEKAAAPFQLRLEHVIDGGSREGQIAVSAKLRSALQNRNSSVQIAVDEWCNTLEDVKLFLAASAADVIHVKTPDLGGLGNTIEALLLVRQSGFAAYCGGTCNETDISAKVSAHIAMACGAIQVLAKPGMGVDEGMMIVGNEMARVMALVQNRSIVSDLDKGGLSQ